MTTSILSTQKKIYKILDNFHATVIIDHNPYSLFLEDVFSMAARDNSKRRYLFVSKLIGKHIPVRPQIPLLTGFLLASRLADHLGLPIDQSKIDDVVRILSLGDTDVCSAMPRFNFDGKVLFLGFAETATALGQSAYACFAENSNYLHTTREDPPGVYDAIYFTEDHCHAPEQKCLVLEPSLFKDKDFIVLVDDEITTGNSGLNIIRAIQKRFPQRRYIVLVILDWRSAAARQKYRLAEEELGVKIDVVSLLSGSFTISGTSLHNPVNGNNSHRKNSDYRMRLPLVKMISAPLGDEIKIHGSTNLSYLRYTGRFGIDANDLYSLEIKTRKLGEKLRSTRKGRNTLCLGTGEFMYIPFCIADHMGEGVCVQSTTRSPVYPHSGPEYAVKESLAFYDPYRPEIKNFVYNIKPGHYDDIYIFWERDTSPEQVQPLVTALGGLGIANITFVSHISQTERA